MAAKRLKQKSSQSEGSTTTSAATCCFARLWVQTHCVGQAAEHTVLFRSQRLMRALLAEMSSQTHYNKKVQFNNKAAQCLLPDICPVGGLDAQQITMEVIFITVSEHCLFTLILLLLFFRPESWCQHQVSCNGSSSWHNSFRRRGAILHH